VSTEDLDALLGAVGAARLTAPVTATKLAAAGLAVDTRAVLRACSDLPPDALGPVLAATLAERRRAAPAVELVWTGPEPSYSTTRDTRRVLDHLFRSAQDEVLVAGFSFDHGAALFAPLHDAMTARAVTCDLFVDIPGDQKDVSPDDEEPLVTAHVAAFLARNWPWPERPRFFYDPRRFDPDVFASIHAKCVVVDSRRAFVTSANFTDRGQSRNVEVGVLVDDPHLATHLAGQLRRCANEGLFRQAPAAWLPAAPEGP
jgi:phosphatidylserine/phosphatidylglycerophosphate/cardiolipin synthase-like enzyme